jgi:hypothetical protein
MIQIFIFGNVIPQYMFFDQFQDLFNEPKRVQFGQEERTLFQIFEHSLKWIQRHTCFVIFVTMTQRSIILFHFIVNIFHPLTNLDKNQPRINS